MPSGDGVKHHPSVCVCVCWFGPCVHPFAEIGVVFVSISVCKHASLHVCTHTHTNTHTHTHTHTHEVSDAGVKWVCDCSVIKAVALREGE